MLEDTGQIGTYGRDNAFVATEVVGESILEACHAAEKWRAAGEEEREAEMAKEEDAEEPEADSTAAPRRNRIRAQRPHQPQ